MTAMHNLDSLSSDHAPALDLAETAPSARRSIPTTVVASWRERSALYPDARSILSVFRGARHAR
jgi:hypothetical protein